MGADGAISSCEELICSASLEPSHHSIAPAVSCFQPGVQERMYKCANFFVPMHHNVKEAHTMNESLLRSWWVPALRGVFAIAFGVLALMWPGLTLLALVSLFSAYALLTGAVSIFGAIRNRKRDDEWWLLLLLGLVGVGAGVVAMIHPGLTTLVLVLLIGANALVTGVLDIAAAIRLRKVIRGEWLLALNGIVAIVFGALIFLFPAAGALALVWMISVYAVATGVLLLAVAFRLRARARVAAPERRVTPDRRGATVHAHS
jgi:uncharacterized membrane protein HdeD (DUF308 family)